MTDSIIAQFIGFFINVDDFCLAFEPEYNKRLLKDGTRKRITLPLPYLLNKFLIGCHRIPLP